MKRLFSLLSLLLLLPLFSCIKEKEKDPSFGPDADDKESITILGRIVQLPVLPSDAGDDISGASRISWNAGDSIIIAYAGRQYVYKTHTSGRESIFRPVDKENGIKVLEDGASLTAWCNVSSVQLDGKGVFAIAAVQKEGEKSNRLPLCATYSGGVDDEGSLTMEFIPMASMLEFSLYAPLSYPVDRVVLTPGAGAEGYTVMADSEVNPGDGSLTPVSPALSPLSVILSNPKDVAGGRNVRMVCGKALMNATGAQMEWFYGNELVYSTPLFESSKIDMVSSDRHYYQEVAVSRVDTLIRSTHPRMFFTEDDLPAMKERIERDAYLKMHEYRWMVEDLDSVINRPVTFPDSLARDGSLNRNHEWGFRLHKSALLWLLTGEQKYLDFSKYLMRRLTRYYQIRNEHDLNIDWYMFSQASAACAWDWLYNDLTPAERAELGPPLFEALSRIAWLPGERSSHYRENVSDHTSGCYGTPMLNWYVALAFAGDGIDDARCERMYRYAYDLNQRMSNYRRQIVGNAPGAPTPCVVYSLGYYPVADFNFLRLIKSATGLDISAQMQYVSHYLDYIDWVTLPGLGSYGFGDEHHTTCKLPVKEINYSLREMAALFGARNPQMGARAARLLEKFTTSYLEATFPVIPFLHGDLPVPETPSTALAGSIYCENMGEVIMRSGMQDDDTYCLFSVGGKVENHKHFDNNHFTIYKHGFRAVDSGTRPEPGLHLPYYFARTVAHNCVTVRMPGETMPEYWGDAAPEEDASLPIPNDGGQCNILGSVLKSLKDTEDYVSLSSDATACYSSAKVSLVEREFIWFKPDLFVVFDRVEAKSQTYPKKWLLHTISEPVMNGTKEFSETSQGGKMICRTLWPADAVLEKIGGPGKEYWSDGRNWPLPLHLPANIPDRNEPNFGHWRMEVSPGIQAMRDCFLHMLMVGNESLSSLPETQVKESGGKLYLGFEYRGKPYTLTFEMGAPSGVDIDEARSNFNNLKWSSLNEE